MPSPSRTFRLPPALQSATIPRCLIAVRERAEDFEATRGATGAIGKLRRGKTPKF
jgi:hypothetical protein